MPRRPSKAADTGKDGGDEPTTASYLDSFLNRITEENDLPGDLKNTLKQLRDLDTQAQEIFERMQKLSKNYIARAKRSVQGGQEPDEEPLHKARKLHKELLELDEQKLAIATESHKSIVQQLQTCEVELTSFAHELREKGQLKDPSKVVTAGEVLSEKTKVAARMSGGHKGQPEEWILAVVQRYNASTSKYVVLDVDAGDDPFGLSNFGTKQHTIPARFVIALPTSEPSHYSTYNEFKAGSTVLALYPDTTCFYKAYVHTPPSQLPPTPQQRHDYLIEFEDENEVSGRSEAIRVPQKYTLRLPS